MGLFLTAQESTSMTPMGIVMTIVMYAVIILAFYFLLMRPNRKADQRKAKALAALEVGDSVKTTSGFYGVVIDISDDTVIVEFGSKNCRISMAKEAIAEIEKPEDALASKSEDKK